MDIETEPRQGRHRSWNSCLEEPFSCFRVGRAQGRSVVKGLPSLRQFLPFALLVPQLPASSRIFIAPLLLFCLWHHRRNSMPPPVLVNGNKRQERRSHMPRRASNVVLHPAL